MKFTGDIAIDAPREAVFAKVRDARFFASCIEGVQALNEIDTEHYTAVLETKGGGTAARKGKGGGDGGAKKPQPRLGAVSTYETDLARADRILDRAGDIDPTNKRDVAAVGGKLLLLGNRKAAMLTSPAPRRRT